MSIKEVEKKRAAALYVRLSSEDKNKASKDEDSDSIKNQKTMLNLYCMEKGIEVYDTYCDDGLSGMDDERPDFLRMLKDCEDGKIDMVICKDQSRFSRSTTTIEKYINGKFIQWNVRFLGISDNSDTNNEGYQKVRLISSAINEMYVQDTSNKIRNTLKTKRLKGEFTGSFAPYGYAIDPKNKNHLVPDEEAAKVVREIFDLFVQGYGYRKIVKVLNERSEPNPTLYKKQHYINFHNANEENSSSQGLWTQSTIYTILHNETYTGMLVQGKSHHQSYKDKHEVQVPEEEWIKIPNAHDAIISADVWNKAKARLDKRVRSSRISLELSPLSGVVKCQICNKPMKRNVYWNKKHTIQYYNLQCATYKTGAMNCPNVTSISGKKLEEYILAEINALIQKFCILDNIQLIDRYDEHMSDLIKEQKKLSDKKIKSENKIATIYDDRLNDIISVTQYKIISEKLEKEIEEISQRILEVENRIEYTKQLKLSLDDKRAVIEKYSKIDALTSRIVDEFIERVYIGLPDDKGQREISIEWKF